MAQGEKARKQFGLVKCQQLVHDRWTISYMRVAF